MKGWTVLFIIGGLKNLFDQVLDIYLSEEIERKCVTPFLVLTSNEQPLDLLNFTEF